VNTNRTVSRNRSYNSKNAAYVYGNAVPKTDVVRRPEEVPKKNISHEIRKNREKSRHMSLGYVFFLAAALCVAGVVLINYIQLQAELTNKTENIARMEKQLNNLKLENDENYNNIVSSIDLEEIKRIAIGELGMTYPQEGQVYTYTSEGYDYLRAVTQD